MQLSDFISGRDAVACCLDVLISEDTRKISLMTGTLLCVFGSRECQTYRKDENRFETDTKGRLYVVDISIDWPSDRNEQTKVLDSWKATQLNLLRQKSVKLSKQQSVTTFPLPSVQWVPC